MLDVQVPGRTHQDSRPRIDYETSPLGSMEAELIERVLHGDVELAVIIRQGTSQPGIEFFTPSHYGQQLGRMVRPKGYAIQPHVHNAVERSVSLTQEVLFVRRGRVRVDFYLPTHDYLESRVLEQGDVILLTHGGHGFQMLESSELIEVKQGPYLGVEDKIRFNPEEGPAA